MASSRPLVSGWDQFNPSNPRKSSSARSGTHQRLEQQAGTQAVLAARSHGPGQPPAAPVRHGTAGGSLELRWGQGCSGCIQLPAGSVPAGCCPACPPAKPANTPAPEEGTHAAACTAACEPGGSCRTQHPCAGHAGQRSPGQGRSRTHHWALPKPKWEAVLAAKAWQLLPPCPRAQAGVGDVSLAQRGISHELGP